MWKYNYTCQNYLYHGRYGTVMPPIKKKKDGPGRPPTPSSPYSKYNPENYKDKNGDVLYGTNSVKNRNSNNNYYTNYNSKNNISKDNNSKNNNNKNNNFNKKASSIMLVTNNSRNLVNDLSNTIDNASDIENIKTKTYYSEVAKNMSDDSLRKAINRMDMERKFVSLANEKNISKGSMYASQALKILGSSLTLATSTISLALSIKMLMNK